MVRSDSALVIMARYPEAGKTKTRLARKLGDEFVVGLYRAFLTDLAHNLVGAEWEVHWAYTPPEVDYRAFIAELVPTVAPSIQCFPQEGPGLAARLLHAFRWTYAHGFERTVVISSDSPHISPRTIACALAQLSERDVVLGPAEDGGYYLIAMCRPYDVFSGIPMSTAMVKEMTVQSALRQGLSVGLLETLQDVDELPDLQRLARLLARESASARVTAAYLQNVKELV